MCHICLQAIGQRRLFADPRSSVFQQVTRSIVHQGYRGAFFLVLEQVLGWSAPASQL